ncbi:MAG: S9 family peptidase [Bacteriovoracaceae bacterium]|jgi:oligopeptidase B|nr:S9 family peptidase [Bacteriovoracaceae bacterium]
MKAPVAIRKEHLQKFGEHSWVDPLHWLKEKKNPEVVKLLNQENDYTNWYLEDVKDLKSQIFNELKSKIIENDSSVPQKVGEYFYYDRWEEGQQYEICCRKKGSLDSAEEVMLNLNELADGKEFFSLGFCQISPNENLLAYGVDFKGDEHFHIFVKDLASGKTIDTKIENAAYSLAWYKDSANFCYGALNENDREYAVFRHTLGRTNSDILIYEEPSNQFFVGCGSSASEKYIFINTGGKITNETYLLSADDIDSKPTLVLKRKKGHEYYLEHNRSHFYILTNDTHKNFRLVKSSIDDYSQESWEECLAASDTVILNTFDVFKGHIVVKAKKEGISFFYIFNIASGDHYILDAGDQLANLSFGDNDEYNTTDLRYIIESPIQPYRVIDHDMNSQNELIKKERDVKDHHPDNYTCYRTFAMAKDGVKIPMTIFHKKGLEKNGQAPSYLYAYGSYGYGLNLRFSSGYCPLMERGFVIALAHVRGGDEMGNEWYESGKFLKKKNTFNDFLSCAEELVSQKLSSSDKMIACGGSAGGLLMGAVANLKGELFKAIVAHVPFVDVVNTMIDESLPLTALEYEEWGNPSDDEYFHYMKSYSPYDNIHTESYPHILATAGLNDPRVTYWEPFKWIQKLRELAGDSNAKLLWTDMESGHGGASGRYDSLNDVALEYAFIFKVLGIKG